MKQITVLTFLIFISILSFGQKSKIDSLTLIYNQDTHLYSFVKEGEDSVTNYFHYASDFSDGYALVVEYEKYGFIDPDIRYFIETKLYDACPFSDSIAYYALTPGKYGYINTKGKVIVKAQYLSATPFKNGFGIVTSEKPEQLQKRGKKNKQSKASEYIYIIYDTKGRKVGNQSFSNAFWGSDNKLYAFIGEQAYTVEADGSLKETDIVNNQEPKASVIADQMPEFPGGIKELRRFIARTTGYPDFARNNGIQGTVYVKFIVNEQGKVEHAQIFKGVHPLLNQEALRVINRMPDFKPGKLKGKAVSVWYSVPVVFKLN